MICARDPLMPELHGTLLWRAAVERYVATSLKEALITAVASRPCLVAVELELPQVLRLIRDLRSQPPTRGTSIVALAGPDCSAARLVEALNAGVNAVLGLPATPEWDACLQRLLRISPRRALRTPIRLRLQLPSLHGMAPAFGETRNLSTSGALVYCELPLRVGDDLDVILRLPGGATLSASARVVRQAGLRLFGLEFARLDPAAKASLESFVDARHN